ncbi:hypothetical protein EX895_001065 [Sporisorium graminicola]|uniref:Uncharacterized protein n=1 Tax=Sporisorium graminicola TaxID=280036 RepID=A0A4U7L1U8_9BASI|nr:hypothetical protein EX895_001065 [Sporisorium graminicola]TKY89768.1 hypothetical protein EX895_001065 [Sporisorium graminicola]
MTSAVNVMGCGLDLQQLNGDFASFRSAIQPTWYPPRLTVREVAMLAVMDALTDKPNWQLKIHDPEIVARWRVEATQQSHLISQRAFDWCILELRDKSNFFQRTGLVPTLQSHNTCVKSDSLLTQSFLDQLKQAIKPLLEHEPKDWHPRSRNQVLDLVHPSLYPLIYGRTRYLPQGAVDLDTWHQSDQGTPFPEQHRESSPVYFPQPVDFYSFRFQWLPCDVAFQGDTGSNVLIRSYINNLEPSCNRTLYELIQRAISLSIQPWNHVLIRATAPELPLRIPCPDGANFEPQVPPSWLLDLDKANIAEPDLDPEVRAKLAEWFAQPDDPEIVEVQGPFVLKKALKESKSLVWSALDKFLYTRRILHPEPGDEAAYLDWRSQVDGFAQQESGGKRRCKKRRALDPQRPVHLEDEYRDRGLQVIVKLASIELTPGNPSYAGGSWHVEGMMNEHIVATSILYYDVENVSEARISFRQNAHLDEVDMPYEQDDHAPLCVLFGTPSLRDEIKLQNIGSIATPNGRLLAFPNTLQHRVEPFELIDKTRPGHRRFLVLWLVDPNYRLASTSIVPPQQQDWWSTKLSQDELNTQIQARGLMTLRRAKTIRLELMNERTRREEKTERVTDTYNFCEH